MLHTHTRRDSSPSISLGSSLNVECELYAFWNVSHRHRASQHELSLCEPIKYLSKQHQTKTRCAEKKKEPWRSRLSKEHLAATATCDNLSLFGCNIVQCRRKIISTSYLRGNLSSGAHLRTTTKAIKVNQGFCETTFKRFSEFWARWVAARRRAKKEFREPSRVFG